MTPRSETKLTAPEANGRQSVRWWQYIGDDLRRARGCSICAGRVTAGIEYERPQKYTTCRTAGETTGPRRVLVCVACLLLGMEQIAMTAAGLGARQEGAATPKQLGRQS